MVILQSFPGFSEFSWDFPEFSGNLRKFPLSFSTPTPSSLPRIARESPRAGGEPGAGHEGAHPPGGPEGATAGSPRAAGGPRRSGPQQWRITPQGGVRGMVGGEIEDRNPCCDLQQEISKNSPEIDGNLTENPENPGRSRKSRREIHEIHEIHENPRKSTKSMGNP